MKKVVDKEFVNFCIAILKENIKTLSRLNSILKFILVETLIMVYLITAFIGKSDL